MFKNVLFPVDISSDGDPHALLGKLCDAIRDWKASLSLIYVVPGFSMPLVAYYFPEGAEQSIQKDADKRLQAFIETYLPKDIPVTPIVTQGTAYEEILKAAESRDVDLIVMPDLDRSRTGRWLVGSTTTKVVEHSRCAVMVLRGTAS